MNHTWIRLGLLLCMSVCPSFLSDVEIATRSAGVTMKIMDSSSDLFVRSAKRGVGNTSKHSPLGNGRFIP